ncbi:MAG: CvpA family protein [Patescibacteria group bacterium]
MPTLDIVLIAIIAVFALFGLWFGLVSSLGSLVGSVAGLYIASRYYALPAEWLMQFTGWSGNFPKFVSFIFGFLIINRLVGIGFYLADKALFIVTSLPIIHGLNKILGFIFGAAEGIIVIGISLYFFQKFPFWDPLIHQLAVSKIAPYCVNIASLLWPLLPEVLKMVKI